MNHPVDTRRQILAALGAVALAQGMLAIVQAPAQITREIWRIGMLALPSRAADQV